MSVKKNGEKLRLTKKNGEKLRSTKNKWWKVKVDQKKWWKVKVVQKKWWKRHVPRGRRSMITWLMNSIALTENLRHITLEEKQFLTSTWTGRLSTEALLHRSWWMQRSSVDGPSKTASRTSQTLSCQSWTPAKNRLTGHATMALMKIMTDLREVTAMASYADQGLFWIFLKNENFHVKTFSKFRVNFFWRMKTFTWKPSVNSEEDFRENLSWVKDLLYR